MAFAEIEFEKLQTLKSQGFEPTCVFDVGASNGGWSKKLATLFPNSQFHMFEPLAETDEGYKTGMAETLAEHTNFSLHCVALGKNEGNVTFNYRKSSPSSSTALEVGAPDRYEQVTLPLITLDGLIESGKAKIPNLVKMDIQGGELEALKGFRRYLPQVELLLLETWLSRGYGKNTPLIHELMNFLEPFGFYLFEVSDCYRNDKGNLISQDFFFVNETCSLASEYRF